MNSELWSMGYGKGKISTNTKLAKLKTLLKIPISND